MGSNLVPAASVTVSGLPNISLQQTITSSSNNISVPNANWVYAVVASGGLGGVYTPNVRYGGASGGVIFGFTPKSSRAIVGGAGGSSAYGAISVSAPNAYVYANLSGSASLLSMPIFGSVGNDLGVNSSGAAGSGGNQGGTAGNSTFGYNGGAGGSGGSGGGGGGGAGIAGNGNAGNADLGNVGGNGGNGGIGGGGGGAAGQSVSNGNWGNLGSGGQGAILLYY